MKYTQELIKSILKERGLSEIEHQLNFLEDIQIKGYEKPYVLGAGPSSGKTEMCILWLEGFYSIQENLKKRTIIVPASKVILRDNFEDRLKSFNPSFKYFVITSDLTKEEFKRIIKDEEYQVIVCLPHALNNNIEILVKFDNFVLDEAHEWYFAKTKSANDSEYRKGVIFNVLKKIDPTIQLLLTGTPSKFIAEKEKFNFFFVTGMELFEQNLITNVQIEIVSSHLDFSPNSYTSTYGDLRKSVKYTKKDTGKSLQEVCEQMIKKLSNPNKGFLGSLGHTLNNNILDSTVGSIGKMFCLMGKTMIICHRQDQANEFHNILNSFKELSGRVLTSHSNNDSDNINFNEFQNNNDIKILIVDFSYSRNLDLLYQMVARLFRKSALNSNKKKVFYKVSPAKTSIFFQDIMTAVLCLMERGWYTKFNGKNMDDIVIPKPSRERSKRTTIESKKQIQKFAPISWENLGIPLDLYLFKNCPSYSIDSSFSTVSFTTLGDCRKGFFGLYKIYEGVNPNNIEEVREFLKENEIMFRSELEKKISKTSSFYSILTENGILDELLPPIYLRGLYDDPVYVDNFIKENDIKIPKDLQKLNQSMYNRIRENGLFDKYFKRRTTVIDYGNSDQIKLFIKDNQIKNIPDLKKRFPKIWKGLRMRGTIKDFLDPRFEVSVSLKDDYNLDVRDEKEVRSFIKRIGIKTKRELAGFENQSLYNALRRNGMLYKIFPKERAKSVKSEVFEKEVTDFFKKNNNLSSRKLCIALGYDPTVKSKTVSKILKRLKEQ